MNVAPNGRAEHSPPSPLKTLIDLKQVDEWFGRKAPMCLQNVSIESELLVICAPAGEVGEKLEFFALA
jgi:hypothetical protein